MGMKTKLLCLFLFLVAALSAQTTLYVAGPRTGLGSAWTGITYSYTSTSTTFISDPINDQQTGQGQDDFVNSPNQPALFMGLGLINNVQSVGFRMYLNKFDSRGFTGNIRIGLDVTGDGQIDTFLGPKLGGSANTQGIVFQAPTGPGNYSPSTTNLGTDFNRIPFTLENYNYQLLTTTIDSNWTNVGTNQNAVLSFSLPIQTLKDILAQSGIVLTDQTYFNILAFSSTQSNAINQDILGSDGIVNNARFDGIGGGFGDYYALDGSYKKRPVTPEPSTYGLIFIGLSLFCVLFKSVKTRTVK